ncbi:MAG TPA: dienelactone hydrolase family protein [Acidimicrobiales bacterium]|jgi:carboxymethylenebutenolidase|nr:dienelactone hydrolase family protein [Acidimicrobiales bacterium]
MRIDLISGTAAELALPEGDATRGVVIVPDIFGLRPLFDDLSARLASEHGWAVCAIEPFPGQRLETIEDRFDAVPLLQDSRIVADTQAAAGVLTERAGCSRVAVMGFCMGGMFALKAVASGRFDKAVSFYGMIRIPLMWRGAGLAEPLEVLRDSPPRPILAIIGQKDPYTPKEDVVALRDLGANVSVVSYVDAEHGFVHDPDRPAHRPGDAADAWGRAVAFLA